MNSTIITIATIIWTLCMILVSLMTFFQKKFKIKDKYIGYAWDIFKYVTGALFGSLVGGING
jgi:hypothetical protein